MTESRERVEEDGIIVSDRFGGLKQHPAAGLERDSRTSMIRALRELGIDIETVAESRPPSRYR
jgi:phage terminase small subunit